MKLVAVILRINSIFLLGKTGVSTQSKKVINHQNT